MTTFTSWDSELCHHGIKGQKWGVRRFQNEDGSLTPEGRKRYYNSDGTLTKEGRREYMKQYKTASELIEKANLNKQAANYQKYQKRTALSGKIAGALGAGAAASYGAGKYVGNKLFKKGMRMSNVWQEQADHFMKKGIDEYSMPYFQDHPDWVKENSDYW